MDFKQNVGNTWPNLDLPRECSSRGDLIDRIEDGRGGFLLRPISLDIRIMELKIESMYKLRKCYLSNTIN